MRIQVIIKILTLLVMLVAVVYAMRQVTPEGMNKFLGAMGVEGGSGSPTLLPSNRPLKPGEERLNICPTRVHAITWADGKKVEEKKEGLKLRWMAFDPQPREINYLEVEKWFSQHCQVAIRRAGSAADVVDAPGFLGVEIEYINGEKVRFRVVGDPIYARGQDRFESDDLREALLELRKIAQFQ